MLLARITALVIAALALSGCASVRSAKLSQSGPPVCDGSTDDYPALNAALTAPGYHWVTLPAGGSCVSSQPLTVNIGYVGVNFNGASIHSTITSGAALTLTSGPNTYNSFSVLMPRLWGDNKPGTVGLQVNANFTALDNENISRFGIGEAIGPNGYLIRHANPYIYNTTTAFSCPGASNAGEQITLDGGALFNSTTGIYNFGCGIVVNGTSIDGTNRVVDNEVGQTTMTGAHLENFAVPSGPWLLSGHCNAYNFIDISHSTVYCDSDNCSAFIENDNSGSCGHGAWSKVRDNFFSGFPTGPAISGTNTSEVAFCNNTNGAGGGTVNNIPNQGPC